MTPPLRFPDRRFQVWEYSASGRYLLLRSNRSDGQARRCDVLFRDVRRLDLPALFDDLEVHRGSVDDLPPEDRGLGAHDDAGAGVYLLRGTGFSGFVVAASMSHAVDDGEYHDPSSVDGVVSLSPLFDPDYEPRPSWRNRGVLQADADAVPPPVRFAGRTFEMWKYTVSHGRLVLRGAASDRHPLRCDVHFKNVRRMNLPTRIHDLQVHIRTEAGAPARETRELGASGGWYDLAEYGVRGENGSGYVVAGIMYFAEDGDGPAAP